MVVKKYTVVILLLFFTVVNISEAIKFEDYKVVFSIDENDIVHGNIYLVIYNNNSEEIPTITYILPHTIYNLKVSSNKNISYIEEDHEEGSTKIEIKFKSPIKKGERCYINISFNGDMIWDKYGKKMFSATIPAVDSNFTMTVILPKGAAVVSPAEGLLSITPQDYTIDTDGKRIYIKWKRKLNKEDRYFTATVSYVVQPINYINDNNNTPLNNFYYNLLLITLMVIIIGAIYGIYYEKKKVIKRDQLIDELSNKINNLLNDLNMLKVELESKDNTISQLKKKNCELVDELSELVSQLNTLKGEDIEKDKIIKELKETCEDLNNQLEDYKSEIIKLNVKLEELEDINKKYREELEKSKRIISEKEKIIEDLKSTLKIYEKDIGELKKKIKEYERTLKNMLMDILTEEEKTIVNLIKEYGEITQKEIVEITGMSKPKVSRIVADLENRGIIKKVKIGRINKLALTDKFRWE
ncbi:MarR family transcriptional regulator [Methanofervidicoccus sp. A16]|uniref:helix-turn-helix transcriptional regulator n=1 Tax=Methanofervidicoccus sp. A16 TaxID=2607662 RepID=UPI001188862C|nr:winged helix-turn-helix transcriptional regulator [Methanofervidicoccus sp. A16]AXI25371.1 MarR family transcriptional regulator [Methanofervidicoccus sp. A16]